jgi:hypothetical protein
VDLLDIKVGQVCWLAGSGFFRVLRVFHNAWGEERVALGWPYQDPDLPPNTWAYPKQLLLATREHVENFIATGEPRLGSDYPEIVDAKRLLAEDEQFKGGSHDKK